MNNSKKPVKSHYKAKSTKYADQFARTRANKIRRIEKEIRLHPKNLENKRLMDRLAELRGGKN